MSATTTPYDRMGGAPFFFDLVHEFYLGVGVDPLLTAMYPEDDLGPAEERLRLFLEQYWGGPTTYSELRGHPRLRQRHGPYAVDVAARDRWVDHMEHALDVAGARHGLLPELREDLWRYFTSAAIAMVNTGPAIGQTS
jgi:hemoglobin